MKYFDENSMVGADLKELHHTFTKGAAVVASNLFFHQVEECADTATHRKKLARSCFNVIGICEAIIARVPEDERDEAMRDVAENFKGLSDGDVRELLGILFGTVG